MLRTPVGLAVAGIVLGGAVCVVVMVAKAVEQITDACALPKRRL